MATAAAVAAMRLQEYQEEVTAVGRNRPYPAESAAAARRAERAAAAGWVVAGSAGSAVVAPPQAAQFPYPRN